MAKKQSRIRGGEFAVLHSDTKKVGLEGDSMQVYEGNGLCKGPGAGAWVAEAERARET